MSQTDDKNRIEVSLDQLEDEKSRILYLCVVCIQTWAEAMTLDQQNQVGGVQQEKNWAKNRPLRYTIPDQCQR